MPAKPDPATALAATLLAGLEARRGTEAYPLPLQRLGELAGAGADPALLVRAAGKKPFADRAVLARKKDPAAPVALRGDLDQLADSPLLLEFALEARCTPERPAWAPEKLAAALVPELRGPFAAAARRRAEANALPAAVGAVPGRSGPLLYLHRLPPPPPPRPPAVELAERLLLVLEAQRRLGPGSYPVPLRRLAELTDPQAPPTRVRAAAGTALFLDRAVVAREKDAAAPVALRIDLAQLATGPELLEFALGTACTPRRPAVPVEKLAGLLVPELREPFAEAVGRRLHDGALPAGVGTVPGKTGPLLYLHRLPPPRKPEVALAEKLLDALTARRQQGGAGYPLTLRQLLELADPAAAQAVVKKAVAAEAFAGRAVLAVKGSADTPVALAEDAGRLAASPLLLEQLLRATRTAVNHAAPAAELAKKLAPALRQPFLDAAGRAPPPTVGRVLHKGKLLFFLLEDVQGDLAGELARRGPHGVQARRLNEEGRAPDFRTAFDSAFDRLRGADDYVSLLDLRRALSAFDRDAFDAGLHALRAAGAYGLRLADGRFGIRPEEREAGIATPDGGLLLFVSRNAP